MSLVFAKPRWYTTTLVSKEKISSKVYKAVFQLKPDEVLDFHPGQTVMLHVAPDQNRAMSIGSAKNDTGEIILYHDVSPGGIGSQWMLARNVGDTCELMGPLGRFVFASESPRKAVFVATGTGVAPFYSMILTTIASGKNIPMALYFGVRFVEDIFLDTEFRDLSQKYPQFSYHLTLSKPPSDWKGLSGHVTEHVFSMEKNLSDCDYYLCGGRIMVEDVRKKLLDKGVAKERIFTELYY